MCVCVYNKLTNKSLIHTPSSLFSPFLLPFLLLFRSPTIRHLHTTSALSCHTSLIVYRPSPFTPLRSNPRRSSNPSLPPIRANSTAYNRLPRSLPPSSKPRLAPSEPSRCYSGLASCRDSCFECWERDWDESVVLEGWGGAA